MVHWVRILITAMIAMALSTCAQGGGGSIISGLKAQKKKKTEVNPTDPDPTGWSLAATPSANDIASSYELLAMLAQSSFDSAAGAAAAGAMPSHYDAGAALALADAATPTNIPTQQIADGKLSMDCYLGANVQLRKGALGWPETVDPASPFVGSKNSTTSNLFMYVEPYLLQYPEQSPTVILTLMAPFRFKNLVEDTVKDNRSLTIALNDTLQSQYTGEHALESHRFWVAKNAITGQTSSTMACDPTSGDGASGASGTANGTYARVRWSDSQQMSGLTMLERFQLSGSLARSYIPRKKGVLGTSAVTIDTLFGGSGTRLALWSAATSPVATITNSVHMRQKSITQLQTRRDQIVTSSEQVLSDLSHSDQSRPVNPLVIQSHFDATEKPLAHVVASGTLHKTAKDSDNNPRWYSSIEFSGVVFDLVANIEPCIPVAGSAVLTLKESESGQAIKKLTVKFSTTNLTTNGDKVKPEITVDEDDSDKLQAKWIGVMMNRRCPLK